MVEDSKNQIEKALAAIDTALEVEPAGQEIELESNVQFDGFEMMEDGSAEIPPDIISSALLLPFKFNIFTPPKISPSGVLITVFKRFAPVFLDALDNALLSIGPYAPRLPLKSLPPGVKLRFLILGLANATPSYLPSFAILTKYLATNSMYSCEF